MLSDQTIGIDELANFLGRAKKTIHNQRSAIAAGKLQADELPPALLEGRKVRYSISAVQEWIKRRELVAAQRAQAAQPKRRGRPRKSLDITGRTIFNK